nr:MAG TPA: hypothetical protein [Caudoviricetes sp.]
MLSTTLCSRSGIRCKFSSKDTFRLCLVGVVARESSHAVFL